MAVHLILNYLQDNFSQNKDVTKIFTLAKSKRRWNEIYDLRCNLSYLSEFCSLRDIFILPTDFKIK